MTAKKFGDWGKMKALLSNPDQRLKTEIRKATLLAAMLLVREIKLGIRNQAPGGEAFAPLAESTIAAKKSSKALLDEGFLIAAITQTILNDGAFVGLLRTSMRPDGQSNANIGAIMEYGATINQPDGTTIVIPPRPFLHPVMEQHREKIQRMYLDAIRRAMTV